MKTESDVGEENRLVSEWQPGAWIGAARRAFGPVAEVVEGEDVVEMHPPHCLLVLWKPLKQGQPVLRRWPYVASIVAVDENKVVDALLDHLPRNAQLWLTPYEVDWALVAEIVMISEAGLSRFHYHQLQRFVEAERAATLQAISRSYSADKEGFRQFIKTVPADLTEPEELDPRRLRRLR